LAFETVADEIITVLSALPLNLKNVERITERERKREREEEYRNIPIRLIFHIEVL